MSSKTSSEIWKFFTKISSEEAKCLICDGKFACKKSCTKGLWDHFKNKHGSEYEKHLRKIENTEQNQGIARFFGKGDPQKKADEQIANLMIRSNCSFLFFESPELRDIYSLAYAKLELRRRQHFRKNVIPSMADEVRRKIVGRVGKDFFSVTSDGWSQVTKTPALLSITVHHVNEDFQRGDFVLDAIPMTGHTGLEIAAEIENALISSKLSPEKVICLVRDNARNMQRASSILNVNSFQCVAHFLHLVMSDALTCPDLSDLIAKIRSWVTFFRTFKGGVLLANFQEKMKTKSTKLIMACPTRWNSTYMMLKSFREQKNTLLAIEGERRGFGISQQKKARIDLVPDILPNLELSDFEFLKELCPLLEIFHRETEKFSTEKSSASTVISTIKRLRDFLLEKNFPNRVLGVVRVISESLNERVRDICGNPILRIELLDPRFAYTEELFPQQNWKIVEQQLFEFVKEKLVSQQTEMDGNDGTDFSNQVEHFDQSLAEHQISMSSDESIEKYDIWAQPKSPCGISIPSTISGEPDFGLLSKIESQLAQFKAGQRLEIDGDLFSWWRQNAGRLPDLAKIARMVHCIPATSVCSERLFSKAGLIYANTLRNRLSGKMVRQILVVKSNLNTLSLAPTNKLDSDDEQEEKDEIA